MPLHPRLIADDVHRKIVIKIGDRPLLHIDGHVDEHRAGTAGGGDVKGLLKDPGNVLRPADDVAVLGEGLGGAGDVRFLKDVPPQQIAAHLPRDDH